MNRLRRVALLHPTPTSGSHPKFLNFSRQRQIYTLATGLTEAPRILSVAIASATDLETSTAR